MCFIKHSFLCVLDFGKKNPLWPSVCLCDLTHCHITTLTLVKCKFKMKCLWISAYFGHKYAQILEHEINWLFWSEMATILSWPQWIRHIWSTLRTLGLSTFASGQLFMAFFLCHTAERPNSVRLSGRWVWVVSRVGGRQKPVTGHHQRSALRNWPKGKWPDGRPYGWAYGLGEIADCCKLTLGRFW